MDDVAIFWDYENVHLSAQGINVPLAEAIIEYSESLGHVCEKKAYSNWRQISDTVVQALYSLGFEPIQVSMGKQNSVDVKLTVDCMSLVSEISSLKHIIIVTGDKDYIPLVTWLKKHKKRVVVIGRMEVVSEHLMLSADEFVSLEELSKKEQEHEESLISSISKQETINLEEGIECLNNAIITARDQGKTTRYEVIDQIMRVDPNSKYNGASSVQKTESESFKSFSEFITTIEEAGKVKTQINEGFKELFLLEEDPNTESDFIESKTVIIDRSHWDIIFSRVEKAFTETEPDHELYGRFMILLRYLREAKKSSHLPYTNRTLKNALSKMVEIGYLVRQADESYRLIENYENSRQTFIERVMEE
ncbi:MAG: NYN domain-containing protein [Candidatus Hermodarchaeota archaeon]